MRMMPIGVMMMMLIVIDVVVVAHAELLVSLLRPALHCGTFIRQAIRHVLVW